MEVVGYRLIEAWYDADDALADCDEAMVGIAEAHSATHVACDIIHFAVIANRNAA